MAEVFTSDGKDRPNDTEVTPMASAVVVPVVPLSIGANARVGVLNDLGAALATAGATINVLDRSASYSQSSVTRRLNDIITASNALGATPALPLYLSTDYNSFTSIVSMIVASMHTIPGSE
jgi:hypothetical protein